MPTTAVFCALCDLPSNGASSGDVYGGPSTGCLLVKFVKDAGTPDGVSKHGFKFVANVFSQIAVEAEKIEGGGLPL